MNVGYNNHHISNITYTKFGGLTIDDTLSWKYHIDRIMSKLKLKRHISPGIIQMPAEMIKAEG